MHFSICALNPNLLEDQSWTGQAKHTHMVNTKNMHKISVIKRTSETESQMWMNWVELAHQQCNSVWNIWVARQQPACNCVLWTSCSQTHVTCSAQHGHTSSSLLWICLQVPLTSSLPKPISQTSSICVLLLRYNKQLTAVQNNAAIMMIWDTLLCV